MPQPVCNLSGVSGSVGIMKCAAAWHRFRGDAHEQEAPRRGESAARAARQVRGRCGEAAARPEAR
eukprot:1418952-Rhodomonas_salina.1